MIRQLRLYGDLAEKYGAEHEFNADYLSTLISGVDLAAPGLKQDILQRNLAVVKDENNIESEAECLVGLGNTQIVHIFPELEGRSRGLTAVVGVALIVAGAVIPGMQGLIYVGAGLLVAAALTPSSFGVPNTDPTTADRPEDRPSFMFNGPVNVIEQGGPVPVVYGKCRVGSTVISGGIDIEQLENYDT